MRKRFAVIGFDHAVLFDVIIKHGGLFQFENNKFYLVAIPSLLMENTKSFGSHRLFTLSDTAFLC